MTAKASHTDLKECRERTYIERPKDESTITRPKDESTKESSTEILPTNFCKNVAALQKELLAQQLEVPTNAAWEVPASAAIKEESKQGVLHKPE